MITQCPQCFSTRTAPLTRARVILGTAGTILGVIAGVALAISSSPASGANTVIRATGAAIALGSLSKAISNGALNGVLGGQAGIALGRMLDDEVLDNYECLKCSHTFKVEPERPATDYAKT
ncbi:MAG TPA: hypothetical protein VK099_05240 [Alcanivoracaceae bacterium]|nr:hypothetical protein [Alcanivoracaceae bacterium]